MSQPYVQNPFQRERNRAGLTQEEAVEHLPFELRTLQGYEAGRHTPRFDHAFAMAQLYGCSVNDFIQQKGSKNHE